MLIVSGAALFRQGLCNILSESSSVAVVDVVGDLPLALGRIGALRPDVVVLDHDDAARDGAIDSVLSRGDIDRLIVLSLRDNRLTLYRRDAVPTPTREQLLAAVLTGAIRHTEPASSGS